MLTMYKNRLTLDEFYFIVCVARVIEKNTLLEVWN